MRDEMTVEDIVGRILQAAEGLPEERKAEQSKSMVDPAAHGAEESMSGGARCMEEG